MGRKEKKPTSTGLAYIFHTEGKGRVQLVRLAGVNHEPSARVCGLGSSQTHSTSEPHSYTSGKKKEEHKSIPLSPSPTASPGH